MDRPTVDPEIASLIPPLDAEEEEALRHSLVSEGCRDPLVVWAETGILLDGHHRLATCQAEGIPYRTTELNFADRLDAKAWVIANQCARRNLTDDQRAVLALTLLELRSEQAKWDRAKAGAEAVSRDTATGQFERKPDRLRVDASRKRSDRSARSDVQAAQEVGVSERKLRQAQVVQEAAPELARQVATGDLTLIDAVREMRRQEQRAKLENIEARAVQEPDGLYDVIVIDPPWPLEKIERDVRPNQAAMDYPAMTAEQLATLPIPAAADCHVWLWTTQRFLPTALSLLETWGLKYVCTFVWHKPGGFQPFGLPQYNCEFALYARRGRPLFADTKDFPTCFQAPRGAHSEKPDAFYDMVRRVTAGRRLDMFNRRHIDGFDGWGNEAV